ncbi:site-specific recombinase XerD [Salibacterium salarium]|uniref:tyrosine-type recombinase/integrase n=1 Tax=Salibacterium salarium TaxID=284579 RepID=UPI0027881014|nr:site-specific integrase [Salibacterium salarium]MDQ0299217.1 site-specific recombinase XerD [Salibacterium salarium]
MTRLGFNLPSDAEKFLNHLMTHGRKESTIIRYRYDLTDFFRYIAITSGEDAVCKTSSITPHIVEGYFYILESNRQYQIRTLKRIQTVLKQYISFLKTSGKMNINPMASLSLDDSIWNELHADELLKRGEEKKLIDGIQSDLGLSDKQKAARPMLAPRNLVIIHWFLYHGLRLHELSSLTIGDINQGQGYLSISENTGNPRVISLSKKDQTLLYHYLQAIPAVIRPFMEHHPLFVAFDFQRQTYRWSYELDMPKHLTEIAIQKMIREERKRVGINRSISARHFRNTFIVRSLEKGYTTKQLKEKLGLNTILTLNKYIEYVENISQK